MRQDVNEFSFAVYQNPAVVNFFGWAANQSERKEVEVVDQMEDIGESVTFLKLLDDPENNDRQYMIFEGQEKYFLVPKNRRIYSVG